MILVADESVDGHIVSQLRAAGHRVLFVSEVAPGISDTAVLDMANHEQALLLSEDKDFGELVYRRRLVANGVVLVRLAGLPSLAKAAVVEAAIRDHCEELPGAFTVIMPLVIRIRRAVM